MAGASSIQEMPNAGAPVAPVIPVVPAMVTMNSDTGFVNVRSGPGLNYTALGTLATGQTATVIGQSTDGMWWLVDYQNHAGWVFASLAHFKGDLSLVPIVGAQ